MKSWVVGIVALAGLAVLIGWLVFNSEPGIDDGKLVVAATIFPLTDIVQNVAGEDVKVVQVIPVGASPHSFRLQPQQVAELQQAQIVFGIGQGLDDQITEAVAEATGARVVNVDAGIEVGDNPHYWLSVPNAQQIASTMSNELGLLQPLRSDLYEEKLASYLAELGILEAELQAAAAGAARKDFVSMHNAWQYLVDQYGFNLAATFEPEEGREPSVAEIRDFGEIVRQFGITKFYTEPGEGDSNTLKFIESEFGLDIRELDPIGGREGTTSYIELMRASIGELSAL